MIPSLQTSDIGFDEEDFFRLPEGWDLRDVAGVAVDASDNVYVFCRGEHPVCVFNHDGALLRSFGEGMYGDGAHGIHAGVDGFIYLIDYTRHAIDRFTPGGEYLWTLGEAGRPAPKWSGLPFNKPTHVAVSPRTGDIYVTDGYGNCSVHRYSNDGHHLRSWGQPGCEPGEFQLPHNIVIDQDDNVFITDRENNRMQVFDAEGRLQAIWHDVYRADALCMGPDGLLYVGELLSQVGLDDCRTLGHRVCVYRKDGKRLARLGEPEIGDGPGQFVAPHGMAVDSAGHLYVGEVSYGMWGKHQTPPKRYRSLRRLRRTN
jgi:sugar lactone lactonase YvrE